jgi:copper chaperone NosL
MKRFLLFVSLSLMFSCVMAFAYDKVEAPESCELCGMDRTVFAESRMLVIYAGGESVGTCSLHCAAIEIKEHPSKEVKSLLVADCKSRMLIDALKAVWVVGGEKSGVMTAVPKWAFATKEDADAFIKLNGGKRTNFEQAMELAAKE